MTDVTPSSGRWLFTTLVVVAIVLVVLGVLTEMRRQAELGVLAKDTEASSMPTVGVMHPTVEAGQDELVLPGSLQAFSDAPIYARASGYLIRWTHDIGSHVKQGELLAEIDAPEQDQDLLQAKAARDQIAANLALAKTTAERWQNLRKSDAVTAQEVDEKNGAYAELQANLAAAEATIKRLDELQAFRKVYAPFSGVVTKRNVDIGTLVNAGNSGQQLFRVAQMDPIRVFVTVPEMSVPAIKPGLKVSIELVQYPGRRFDGAVVRNAESIDPATRTLLTEIDVPNKGGELLPGGYAQVHLKVGSAGERLQVPVNGLLFRSEGLRAVVIDESHHAHLRALTIGRDYGTSLEVLQGLSKDDWIVLNPPDSIEDGQAVHVNVLKPAGGAK
jgi:multidrug efflux system membrane fusion protein